MRKKNLISTKYRSMLAACLTTWIINAFSAFIDEIWAGMFLGDAAVSAIALYVPINAVFGIASCLTSVGMATVFSKASGALDKEKSAKISGMSMILGIIEGAIFAAALFIFKNPYFAMYGSSLEVTNLAKEYYIYLIPGAFVYPAYTSLYYLVNNDGDANTCLIGDASICVINAVLSYILVDPMGIKGIALATSISYWSSFVVLFTHMKKKNNGVHFKAAFSFEILKESLAVSSIFVLNYLFLGIVDVLMNRYVISNFGDPYLPCYAIVNLMIQMSALFYSPGTAAEPFITMGWGENNPKEIRRAKKMTDRSTFIMAAVFTVLLLIAARYLPDLHGITDPEIRKMAVYSAVVLAFAFPVEGYITNMSSCLAVSGRVVPGLVIQFVFSLAGPICFVYLFGSFAGFKGLVWGFFAAPFAALLAVFVFIAVKYGIKKFPYILPDSEDEVFCYDLSLCDEEIKRFLSEIDSDLSCIKDNETKDRIIRTAEAVIGIIKSKNNEKEVLAYCSLMVGQEKARMIIRDNGRVFDLSKEAGMEDALYMTSVSFNSNSFDFILYRGGNE